MNEILVEYRSYLIALFIALIPVYFAVYIHNRNRFNLSASAFRNIVLTELNGIVPVNGFWTSDVYPRIRNTIPTIKQSALEFRPSVPFFRKSKFDRAVTDYCEQGQNINWEKAISDSFWGSEVEETQKEKFVKCVFHLLSFTE